MKKKIFSVIVFLVGCIGFVGAESILWGFTITGDYQGWFDQGNRMTHGVSGDMLNYTISAQADPQWRQETGLYKLNQSKDITFEVVVKRTAGTARAQTEFYVNTVKIGAIQMADNNDWQTLNFTYTGGTVSGPITLLRFDPASGQNGSWAIDSITAVQLGAPRGLSLVAITN
jgi:hypothetical protein